MIVGVLSFNIHTEMVYITNGSLRFVIGNQYADSLIENSGNHCETLFRKLCSAFLILITCSCGKAFEGLRLLGVADVRK